MHRLQWREEAVMAYTYEMGADYYRPKLNFHLIKFQFLFAAIYRVGQVVVGLGWVDIDFVHSTTCPILLGQLDVWQNGLWS